MTEILCLSGSLRKDAYSTAVLRTVCRHIEDRVETTRFDIGSLPHYHADITIPSEVEQFKAAIDHADGLIIVTPEYNYSVPGVLKNAIDWASRPGYQSVFKGKPVFVASVSGGAMGGVRAQGHLKQVLNAVLAHVFPWQEILVPNAGDKIRDGFLVDQATHDFLMTAVDAFLASVGQSDSTG